MNNGGINITNQKKMLSTAVISMMLVSLFVAVVPMTVAVPIPCTVRGYVYVDGIITTPDQITLTFPEQGISAYIPGDPIGYYIIDFTEEVGETGTFDVTVYGKTLTAAETITIQSGVYLYKINLTVNTPPNNPPDKPSKPSPGNNSEDVTLNPTLSVYVTDPDEDTMNISFYNASNDNFIGTAYNIPNGTVASVEWSDLSYNTTYHWYAVANDSQLETRSDTWTFTTKENNPPDQPTNPSPKNNSKDIDLNPTLSVYVTDPDEDTMNVSFYNASDDSLIDIATNVTNGSTASITWSDLNYNTTYYWYAVANDSQFETRSDTWQFTTKKKENIAPKVEIIKPERAVYINNVKKLPRLFRIALIIGDITIEVNATDEDSGIEKVEFYINGKLKGNDASEPYTYNWTRDRLRLVHIFCIKVVAYDNDGATAEDCTTVRKFL